MYVQFECGPQKICKHIQGQVSGSMESDPVKEINTSQPSTKEDLCEELEGCLRSIKPINWFQKEVTLSRHPCHDLPQAYEGSKYVCPVWIRPT